MKTFETVTMRDIETLAEFSDVSYVGARQNVRLARKGSIPALKRIAKMINDKQGPWAEAPVVAPLTVSEVYERVRSCVYDNSDDTQFRSHALEAVELTAHPKADKAYALAWEHGHSAGYCDVLSYLVEFAELVK